ncbi:NAD(P)H-dependent oxidoreductase [Halosquirtibacter xylanolyticus]|uniref:NAD(P)H-dependent oxidoreductase n=1 Tax=Halosquirtibacter xylanolyticus TaxID=3374599 RepID=UPI003747B889|nr:NAD(P)H-dependent oxidoreductase [Prolixibacteraceae bacterium]
MKLLEQLQWRYATKRFAPEKKISKEQLLELKEAIRLAPTSFGLQPFKVFVVQDYDIRKKLQEYAWNQPQIVECSHLLVFACKEECTRKDVDEYIQLIASVRKLPVEALNDFKEMMYGWIDKMTPEQMEEWTTRQVYLALGVALTATATMQIDACPMEGFDPIAFDEILDIRSKGYGTKVLIAIGHRSDIDHTQSMKKVRKGVDELFDENY